jgi:hypothetical protein
VGFPLAAVASASKRRRGQHGVVVVAGEEGDRETEAPRPQSRTERLGAHDLADQRPSIPPSRMRSA